MRQQIIFNLLMAIGLCVNSFGQIYTLKTFKYQARIGDSYAQFKLAPIILETRLLAIS